MSPRVIYLDQFVLSNAYLDEARGATSTWRDLVAAIRGARDRGALVCPTSQFHEAESPLHKEGEAILSFARELAREPGRRPKVARVIDKWSLLTSQAVPALYSFLEVEAPKNDPVLQMQPWDLHAPIYLPPIAESSDWRARRAAEKERFQREIDALVSGPWSAKGTFKKARARELGEREQFVVAYYGAYHRGEIPYVPPGLHFIDALLARIHPREGGDVSRSLESLVSFFASSVYAAIPTVAIESGLWAAAREASRHGSHKITPNDILDFEMLSHVGPFVDFIVVDGRTANLARQPRAELPSHAPRLNVVGSAREARELIKILES